MSLISPEDFGLGSLPAPITWEAQEDSQSRSAPEPQEAPAPSHQWHASQGFPLHSVPFSQMLPLIGSYLFHALHLRCLENMFLKSRHSTGALKVEFHLLEPDFFTVITADMALVEASCSSSA